MSTLIPFVRVCSEWPLPCVFRLRLVSLFLYNSAFIDSLYSKMSKLPQMRGRQLTGSWMESETNQCHNWFTVTASNQKRRSSKKLGQKKNSPHTKINQSENSPHPKPKSVKSAKVKTHWRQLMQLESLESCLEKPFHLRLTVTKMRYGYIATTAAV